MSQFVDWSVVTSNPYHRILLELGWRYSHTTEIYDLMNCKYKLHTYKLGEWNFSIRDDEQKIYSISRSQDSKQIVTSTYLYLVKKTQQIKKGIKNDKN